MDEFRVKRAPTIGMELCVPGDKSISHRAIMLAALSNGTCEISNLLTGEDCLATMRAMQQMGVNIERLDDTTAVIHGNRGRLSEPAGEIDCGNSGTTMRLLSGILAAQSFESRLIGDESLSKRPMRRVITPLKEMGARISAEGGDGKPPLFIMGSQLHGIEYEMPVASAQVKSAILLATLFATGRTTLVQPGISRDHTERMLRYFLITFRQEGNRIVMPGEQVPESRDFHVPGDISSAAFWMVAAAAQPGAHLLLKDVGLNPTRTGIIDVLVRMRGRVREIVENMEGGEPRGTIEVHGGELCGTTISGEEIGNVIDELPILAVAGALAKGVTVIRDAQELRVKETDRIAAIVTNLRAMGVHVEEAEDGMEIHGQGELVGATVESFGDHRMAMAFAIAGLFATGETIVRNAKCVATSYPGFADALEQIQKGRSLFASNTPVIGDLYGKKKI